jgi:hypothetical protein
MRLSMIVPPHRIRAKLAGNSSKSGSLRAVPVEKYYGIAILSQVRKKTLPCNSHKMLTGRYGGDGRSCLRSLADELALELGERGPKTSLPLAVVVSMLAPAGGQRTDATCAAWARTTATTVPTPRLRARLVGALVPLAFKTADGSPLSYRGPPQLDLKPPETCGSVGQRAAPLAMVGAVELAHSDRNTAKLTSSVRRSFEGARSVAHEKCAKAYGSAYTVTLTCCND